MTANSDPARFAELYGRYAGMLLQYARGLCGRRDEAEDLVSEAFLRVWNSAVPLRLETVRSYLLAIVRNLYLEQGRKRRRERPMAGDLAGGEDLAKAHASRDRWRRTARLLAELPEVTRSALIMHSLLEMPYAEIERVLGVPAAALKVRVCRARIRLAEKLEVQG